MQKRAASKRMMSDLGAQPITHCHDLSLILAVAFSRTGDPATDIAGGEEGLHVAEEYLLAFSCIQPTRSRRPCWLLRWNKSFIFLSSVRELIHGGRNHARSVRTRDRKIQKNSSRTNRCELQGAQRVDVAHLIETGSTPLRPGQDTRAASRARLHSSRMGWPGEGGLPPLFDAKNDRIARQRSVRPSISRNPPP